jgi:hypothetical protein
MTDKKKLDENISRIVRSFQKDVPPEIEEKIRAATRSVSSQPERTKKRPFLWPAIASGAAAAVLLVAMLLAPIGQKSRSPEISEIRTIFELADKNITIIFIQKPDFHLFKED